MRNLAICFIFIALSSAVDAQTWIQYTQPQLYCQDFNPTVEVPAGLPFPELSVSSLEPTTLNSVGIMNISTIKQSKSLLTTNFSTIFNVDLPQTYIYGKMQYPESDIGIHRFIYEVKDQITKQVLVRKALYDGLSYYQRGYYVNTTKACKIRVNVTSIGYYSAYTSIVLMRPGSVLVSENVTESRFQGPVNTLEVELNQPGQWILKLRYLSAGINIYELTVETPLENSCQNFCFGKASESGSSGWDLSGQNCICNVGTYHNPYFGCGQIDCASKGLEYSSENSNQCQCQEFEVWNTETKECMINCSPQSVPHSLGYLENGVCLCQDGYSWKQDRNICQSDCAYDSGSTGILLRNGQCQCLDDYYWNKTNSACYANCNQELAGLADPTDPRKCICRQSAIWSLQKKECVLDCLNIEFSTGQEQSHEVCECLKNTNWNPSKLQCELACERVQHSTGELGQTEENECVCLPLHEWVPDEAICRRVCDANQFTIGLLTENGVCQCTQNAKWNFYLEKCVALDCGEIAYSLGPSDDGTTCQCQNSFVWNPPQYLCVLDCLTLNDQLGTGLNVNSYECGCKQGSLWDQASLVCVRQCELVGNSTGKNINTHECECQLGYEWQTEGYCATSCGGIGQTGNYDSTNLHCQCLEDYDWSFENNACYRLCQNYPNALPTQGPEQTSCYCYNGMHWDADQISCVLDCDGEFDVSINADETQCVCQSNTEFIVRQKKCLLNCNMDMLSTHVFHINACICKAHAIWNQALNKCECEQNYIYNQSTENCDAQSEISAGAISIAVLGGSMLSGAGIFLGMKVMRRRKEDKKEEKNKQQEQPNLESQKEIVEIGPTI